MNSAEVLAGSHITAGSTYIFHRSDPHNLIHNDNVSWYDGSNFLDNYDKWIKLLNTDGINDVTNNFAESIKSNF